MTPPPLHARRHDDPPIAVPALTCTVQPNAPPHTLLWQYHCQPAFAAIRKDLDQVKTALFIGDQRQSLVAQLHAHGRTLKYLTSVHLIVITAVITILATALYDARQHAAQVHEPPLPEARETTHIENLNSPLDEYDVFPVPSDPSERVAFLPPLNDLGGSCQPDKGARP